MYSNPTRISTVNPMPSCPDGQIPFAPLITAKIIDNNIFVRSILFVDANVSSVTFPPTVVINGNSQENPSVSSTGNTLCFYFTYNNPEEIPTAYNTWYSEQSYVLNQETNLITEVEVYLLDTDPVTSRGTRTTVQQS